MNDAGIWKAISDRRRLVLLAGPCVIESEKLCAQVAKFLKKATAELGIAYIFKASFDKANRSSGASFRGPGIDEGLGLLLQNLEQDSWAEISKLNITEAEAQALEEFMRMSIERILESKLKSSDVYRKMK